MKTKPTFTYLGHSTFLVRSSAGKHILIDPWLKENPSCPSEFKAAKHLPEIDIMLISHGHFDHMGDAVCVGLKDQPQTLANYEICSWLASKGLKNTQGMNKGGSLVVPGAEKITVTLGHALHSSSIQDGDQVIYGGEACSFVVELEDGFRFYHAGDTMVFGDMKLIGELYKPDLAMLPIGSRFTMDAKQAAKACELLGIQRVIPMHFGTFPLLTGTAKDFENAVKGMRVEVITLKPGQTF